MKNILFLFLTAAILFAQESKFPYELSKVTFEEVEFFPSNEVKGKINSVTFSPDGKEVYFSFINQNKKVKIYFSKFENGTWNESKPVSFSSDRNDNNPFITHDGKRLYFASQRGLEYSPSKNDYDIWYVERADSVWGEPIRINNPSINTNANEGTPAVDKLGNLYFSSNREEGFGKNDIYLAKFDGSNFLETVNMGQNVNSAFDDFFPYVDSDSKFMLFASYRGEGNGLSEIYFVALNNYSPENLKPLNSFVNTIGYEYAPYIDPSGKYIFFVRINKSERKILYIDAKVVGVDFNCE